MARANIARAGLSDVVDLRLGRAIDTLPRLAAEGAAPFDLCFIDADKPSNADYFRWALKLSRPGSLIIIDNVVRRGAVVDADSTDEDVRGTAPSGGFDRGGTARQCHGDSDRRQQELRRFRDGAGRRPLKFAPAAGQPALGGAVRSFLSGLAELANLPRA